MRSAETSRLDGDIIYLDNAATTFSPEPVVEALAELKHHYRANVGRGVTG